MADVELILCRIGEIWLKGKNRREFVGKLRGNLQQALNIAAPGARVNRQHDRLFVRLTDSDQVPAALAVCSDTPGLTSVSPVLRVANDLETIRNAALGLAAEWGPGTFAVKARRTWKGYPLTSPEAARQVGGAIQEASGRRVDLKHADHELGLEVGEEHAHLWARVVPGVGGLPVGISGKVLLLLSGGIDSPVAGYLAQKRGCQLEAAYFHSPPFVGEASREKVETLARKLARRQGVLALHVVHFTEIQKAIRVSCDGRLTVLLYRRFMYRIAGELARRRNAKALCTGENLGQVASQTLENLAVVDALSGLLTLRPLMCFDKQETMALARRIDTYDTSVLPHEDCCTLFVPRHPALRATSAELEAAEAALDVDGLVAEALERTDRVECGRPGAALG